MADLPLTGDDMEVLFDPRLSKAVRDSDVRAVEAFLTEHPEYIRAFAPFAGGTWLHYAAGAGDVDVVACMIRMGCDVNSGAKDDGRLALKDAAYEGKSDNVRYLLEHGSNLDVSSSTRNPLFGAIVGKSLSVVQLLLERGIDASVRYNSETMQDMDATAFALMRGEAEIARAIAHHNAGGDAAKADKLLAEAQAVASRHGPMKQVRIVPALEHPQRE